ncbi:hypothetical protein DERP_000445 [Dermatophagoides pteronyssinus]|uniref:Uncharacterized protein n=1 Tax=Dermatophagoides pteronyssinus TaxID=6956 RepID=A0ABQ8J055_DERPT|nr:hypothetical protein DERP_000445 [Dermatophagoides pteronyssinus]
MQNVYYRIEMLTTATKFTIKTFHDFVFDEEKNPGSNQASLMMKIYLKNLDLNFETFYFQFFLFISISSHKIDDVISPLLISLSNDIFIRFNYLNEKK